MAATMNEPTAVTDSPFLRALRSRVLVVDGAMGTSLQAIDLTADDFGGREGWIDGLVLRGGMRRRRDLHLPGHPPATRRMGRRGAHPRAQRRCGGAGEGRLRRVRDRGAPPLSRR